jgi:hypothetical protein
MFKLDKKGEEVCHGNTIWQILMKEKMPVAYCKLNPAQCNFLTIKHELWSIVEGFASSFDHFA